MVLFPVIPCTHIKTMCSVAIHLSLSRWQWPLAWQPQTCSCFTLTLILQLGSVDLIKVGPGFSWTQDKIQSSCPALLLPQIISICRLSLKCWLCSWKSHLLLSPSHCKGNLPPAWGGQRMKRYSWRTSPPLQGTQDKTWCPCSTAHVSNDCPTAPPAWGCVPRTCKKKWEIYSKSDPISQSPAR